MPQKQNWLIINRSLTKGKKMEKVTVCRNT